MQQCMNLYYIDSACPIKRSVDSIGNHTQVHAYNYTSWNALNCTKYTTRQRVTVIISYIPVLLKLKGTSYLHSQSSQRTVYIRTYIAAGLVQYIKQGSGNVAQNLTTYRLSVLRSERLSLPAGRRVPTIMTKCCTSVPALKAINAHKISRYGKDYS